MTTQPSFQSASPYKDDVLALPVTDLDAASEWHCKHLLQNKIASGRIKDLVDVDILRSDHS